MRFYYRVWRWIVTALVNVLFRFRVSGREHVPRSGKLIVVANHESFLDPPVIAAAVPRELNFMAKAELFEKPLLAGFIRSLNTFPVHRGARDLSAIKHAISLLKAGKVLLIFPQGTRGRSMDEAEDGAAFLIKKTGAPVLPLKLIGTDKALPPDGSKPVPGTRVDVRIGALLEFHPDDDIASITRRLVEALKSI